MATMNVNLPGEMVDFVDSEVEAGAYASPSDVVREALALLQREKAEDQVKLTLLREAVQVGLADAAEGRFSTLTVRDIMDEVLAGPRSR